MNCQEVMELMQRHVDKDLNEQETSLMMDHVGQCPECAAMLERLVLLSRGLEQMPRIEPPYSLVDAILPQLAQWDQEEPQQQAAPDAPNGRRVHRPRRAWIARISSVVALGALVAVFAMNGPFFSGMGSSSQKEASLQSGAANTNESGAYSLKSEALRKDMKAADQSGNEIFSAEAPMADQAPAAAPSADSQSLQNKSGSAGGSSADDSPTSGSAESADRIRGSEPGSADQAGKAPMAIMDFAPDVEEALSPDGQWKAVLTGGTLQIYRTSDADGAAAYERAPDSGIRGGLVWREDSSALNYTYTDAEGKTHERSILVPEMKEIER